MMSKARKGHMLPSEIRILGLTSSYEQRLTFTRKKPAVVRTMRNSVSFLSDVTNLHGSLLRD